MSRKLLLGSVAALTLVASACGSGSSDGSASDGIASLDTVAPASADGPSDDTDSDTGSDSDTDTSTSTGDGGTGGDGDGGDVSEEDFEEAYAAYEKCVEDVGGGGILPTEGSDGAAVEGDDDDGAVVVDVADIGDDVFERLQEECDPLLENVVGDFEMSPEQEAEIRDMELEFARCMRDEGIEMGDPGGGDGMVIEFEIGDDADQDAMDAAFDKCDSVFDELNAQFEGEGG